VSSLGVLITYFNEGEWLRRAVLALQAMQPPIEEIWINDDCGAVPAASLVGDLLPAERIVRAEKNEGPARGRNRLLKLVRTDYVHFHDADDERLENFSAALRPAMIAKPDFILSEVQSYQNGRLLCERVMDLANPNTDLAALTLCGALLTAAVTWRLDYLRGIGGYSGEFDQSEDYELGVRSFISKPITQTVDAVLARTHMHEGNRSLSGRAQVWRDGLRAIDHHFAGVDSAYRDRLAERAAYFASELYRSGDHQGAANGFAIAARCGRPRFTARSRSYAFFARTLGPMYAEKIAFWRRSNSTAAKK
jgi:glycosyltransferase involved in cell wall biosynthesis